MNHRVVIATGGTGGHIFPARATALDLSHKGFKATIFSDQKYKKSYHKKKDRFSFNTIPSSPLNKGTLPLILTLIKISLGVAKSFLLMLIYRPKIVMAFGSYASLPPLVSAVILRRKIIIHEQNAYLGRVNRLFAKYASIIALSYEKTDGIRKEYQDKTHFVGNPIRKEILKLNKEEYLLPKYDKNEEKDDVDNLGYNVLLTSQFKEDVIEDDYSNKFNILVIGGSGGAGIFSEILPKAFFNIRDDLKDKIRITQQCRKDYVEDTFNQYQSFNIDAVVNSFFEKMGREIKKAHLVIARSGSSSIAEFSAAKKPMILVPFAKSADDHQLKNAQFIEKSGAAIVIKEKDFTISNVTRYIEDLINNPKLLKKMSKASFSCANVDATRKLSKLVKSLL
ncbi:MAG: UDP-N-acetylglucosamine--N-acetylmuramyl-(pentapeptide) pyrophosphoryl-undecaprenol N-acetylglucosamine transferase [Proteobacteria bacterium]|nr:UDP-N-acetylglucosamine--N-acetylmuramyl-(pentapeptide) pyrophosphoryl-undecaprenol N-acetylglucosamine transferase [Pseudomonadota bacterium]